MFVMGEKLLLKKLDILTFLFVVTDYDDEYLNACGMRMYKEGGKVYALQKEQSILALALLSGVGTPYIVYLFTPPELRRQGYARAMLEELQKNYSSLKCSVGGEGEVTDVTVVDALLRKSGFVADKCVNDFAVKIDDIRKWSQSSVWEKYQKYAERYRQKGWETVAFANASVEQREYVMNSFNNDFQSELNPKKILKRTKKINPYLSFILLKDHRPVAYNFITHSKNGNWVFSLASTAKNYLGNGCIFLLYLETATCLCQSSEEKEIKYYISDDNRASLKTAEHFCSQLKLKKCKRHYYVWERTMFI